MSTEEGTPASVRWARLRHSIVAPLLSSPSERGELAARIADLASRAWKHPTTGEPERFSAKAIERWYYTAREADDAIAALARKVPRHAGTHPSVPKALAEALRAQHAAHPSWTYQLHYDNARALAKSKPEIGPVPGYAAVRRTMKSMGLYRVRKKRAGREAAGARETRSYEQEYVHALWHLDFHEGSRAVLLPSGQWKKPKLLGILDDHSRLCCHLQWYLDETTETLVDGVVQAILKRGQPCALMMDNGSAMKAAETQQGLVRLGIEPRMTLEYSPEQNGKQESFWGRAEGRLLAMLEGHPNLTLDFLNRATIAWVEQEYHRTEHSEIRTTPLSRYLNSKHVGKPSPSVEKLRRSFRKQMVRTQRRSDGTVSVEGVRFEVPSAYRTLERLTVRVARWDLSNIDLVDPHSNAHLATLLPLDKHKNADGLRRVIAAPTSEAAPPESGVAPLLQQLMADYAATGLPPAYLPKHELTQSEGASS